MKIAIEFAILAALSGVAWFFFGVWGAVAVIVAQIVRVNFLTPLH